jgi:FkbM family methyltransferase
MGYRGKIISFEPLPDAVGQLGRLSRSDPRWQVLELAVGEFDGVAQLNVAANSVSSSLLTMLPSHEEMAPHSKIVATCEVEVKRLDTVLPGLLEPQDRAFLKIDAQGYERRILEGGRASLAQIVGVQVELSLVPLYAGAPPMLELIDSLDHEGFRLMSVEPGFSDQKIGRLLQLDGVFFRDPTVPSIGADLQAETRR